MNEPSDTAGEPLRIVIVGHVDHGKSTLVGRLFHDTGLLPEGRLAQLQAAASRRGVPFEWANLMDALQSERDQNITIDTAQIWFRTPRRRYVIIDAPGHREFLKNMVTGAAMADAALLLVDADEGVQENSRRHAFLLNFLGIRQVAVVVNKMDLAGFQDARFREVEAEYRAWLMRIGLQPQCFIPICARDGDNIAARSDRMRWWHGPTVVEALDAFQSPVAPDARPLRFPVQDIYRFDNRRIVAGRVESGTLRVGDRIFFSPTDKSSVVKSIERWNVPPGPTAHAGESIGVTLVDQVFVERGSVAAHDHSFPCELAKFKARLIWFGHQPLSPGRAYKLKLTTQEAEVRVECIHRVLDSSSLDARPAAQDVRRHEVAEVTLRTQRMVAFDSFDEIPATGRFVIVDGYDVAGGGVILPDNYPRRIADSQQKSANIFWCPGKVTPAQRALRNGHRGCVIWLTGLSGSGKSTIAIDLERELFRRGRHTYILDGDNIRHGLNRDLGFSAEDRTENIRRIGEVATLFADAGVICVTAFISPYRADRDAVRSGLPPGAFVEVHVNAPIEVCEQRDAKGLYAKARQGMIPNFTGISAPYEAPISPELDLPTDQLSVEECVQRIAAYLESLQPLTS